LLSRMSLEEKIGQMVQAEHTSLVDATDVSRLFLGSLLAGGDADPRTGNRPRDWSALIDASQERALDTPLRIPLLFGTDAVHGHSNVVGAVIFPHNIGMGCMRNPALVEAAARITGEEVRATGVNWTFAPCVAVPRDKRWGRTYEGFAESPEIVTSMGTAAVNGFQRRDLTDPLSIVACTKHFAGDGGTTFGSGPPKKGASGRYPLDEGDTACSEETLRAIHLPGYRSAIDAGVATVMASYSSWNGQKVSGHRYLLTDVLKRELRFEGLVISDYNAIDQLPGDYKAQIALAANAGIDMFMVPSKYRELHRLLLDLGREGGVPMARVDDAVLRILRVKAAAGLLDGTRSPFADARLQNEVGSDAHRALARACVRESLVLLRNEHNALPLAKSAGRIHVTGKCANDIGNQCGGWTIDWQGRSGHSTIGASVLKAIEDAASPRTRVTFSHHGNGARGADVAIAVIGERPYAEFMGDRETLELDPDDVAAIRNLRSDGVRVVAVVISGRPLLLHDIIDHCDAIVAAWLPGSEGSGVADVLFGDYKPTGRLSVSWPRANEQSAMNHGDAAYDPQFPFGFGLTF
jgi:beta-glucosidase